MGATRVGRVGDGSAGGSFSQRLVTEQQQALVAAPQAFSASLRALLEEMLDLGVLNEIERHVVERLSSEPPRLREVVPSAEALHGRAADQAQAALEQLDALPKDRGAATNLHAALHVAADAVGVALAALREDLANQTTLCAPEPTWTFSAAAPGLRELSTLRGIAVAALLSNPGLRIRGYANLRDQRARYEDASKALGEVLLELDRLGNTGGPLTFRAERVSDVPGAVARINHQLGVYAQTLPQSRPLSPSSLLEGGHLAGGVTGALQQELAHDVCAPEWSELSKDLGSHRDVAQAQIAGLGARMRKLEDGVLAELWRERAAH